MYYRGHRKTKTFDLSQGITLSLPPTKNLCLFIYFFHYMCNKVLHLLWACHTLKTKKKTQLEKKFETCEIFLPLLLVFFIWVAVFVCLFLLGYAEKVSTYLSCGVGFRGEWKQVILCQAFDMWHKSRKTIVNECRVFRSVGFPFHPKIAWIGSEKLFQLVRMLKIRQ